MSISTSSTYPFTSLSYSKISSLSYSTFGLSTFYYTTVVSWTSASSISTLKFRLLRLDLTFSLDPFFFLGPSFLVFFWTTEVINSSSTGSRGISYFFGSYLIFSSTIVWSFSLIYDNLCYSSLVKSNYWLSTSWLGFSNYISFNYASSTTYRDTSSLGCF